MSSHVRREDSVGSTGTQEREATVHHPEPSATPLGTRGLCLAQGRRLVTFGLDTRAILPGIRSLAMAAICFTPLMEQPGRTQDEGPCRCMGKACSPQWMRRTARDGSRGRTALWWGACESTVAAVSSVLCGGPSEGSQGVDDHIKRVPV